MPCFSRMLMCSLMVLVAMEDMTRGASGVPCFAPAAPVLGVRERARSCPLRCRAVARSRKAELAEGRDPKPSLRSIETANSLAEDGIVRVSVDLAAVEEMQALFQQLRETTGNQFRRCAPTWGPVCRSCARDNIMWTEEIPCSVEASNFCLADGVDEVYDV